MPCTLTDRCFLYQQLARKGADVVILEPKGGAIRQEDLEAALNRPTDLVAISLVSRANGFRHDLDLVCRLATPGALESTRISFRQWVRFHSTSAAPVSISALAQATNG